MLSIDRELKIKVLVETSKTRWIGREALIACGDLQTAAKVLKLKLAGQVKADNGATDCARPTISMCLFAKG